MIPYFSFSQIQLGSMHLQVWGFFVSMGSLAALLLSLKEAKRNNIDEDDIWNIIILTLIGMIIGSKVLYIMFSGGFDLAEPEAISGSGFSLIGGMMLSLLIVYFYAISKKMDIWLLADTLIPGLILALIFVRIGCFLIYEHIGSLTNLPWGQIYLDRSIRHPVSLYLLINDIVIFLIIWYLKKRQITAHKGALFLATVLYYSISRFLLDLARCSDLAVCDHRYLGLTSTQWILLVSIPVIFYLLKSKVKSISNN